MTPTHRRPLAGGALATVAAMLLAACTPTTVEPSPSASVTVEAPSTTPSVAVTATPQPSATPEPTATANKPSNDPGDGVGTDDPVVAPTPTGGSNVARVDVHLTSWGSDGTWFDAAALVQGVVADDARCVMVMTKGGDRVTVTGSANRSASSSACAEGLRVRVADLAAGEWTFSIRYEAPGYEGVSESQKVSLP